MLVILVGARQPSMTDVAVVHLSFSVLMFFAVFAATVTLRTWWAGRGHVAAYALLPAGLVWLAEVAFLGFAAIRSTDIIWSFNVVRAFGYEWAMIAVSLVAASLALLIAARRPLSVPWLVVAQIMGLIVLPLCVGMVFGGFDAIDFN